MAYLTPDEKQLAKEAGVVSLAIVPIFLTIDAILGDVLPAKWHTIASVALSAGLLHVGAEYAGVNEWYLEHSLAASKKNQQVVAVADGYVTQPCSEGCPVAMGDIHSL